jgi:small subunit ribosomal protein S11
LAKQESQKQQQPLKKTVSKAKKKVRSIPVGVVHVRATFNNTIVTITDLSGNVVSWASAGKVNFSGSRKSSAFAATLAAQDAAKVAMSYGLKEVEINLKGPGAGRESAVRGIQSAGLLITAIRDKTPVPHNGCRPRKRRRV